MTSKELLKNFSENARQDIFMNNVYYTDQFINKIFVIEDGTEKLNGVIRAASYQEKE